MLRKTNGNKTESKKCNWMKSEMKKEKMSDDRKWEILDRMSNETQIYKICKYTDTKRHIYIDIQSKFGFLLVVLGGGSGSGSGSSNSVHIQVMNMKRNKPNANYTNSIRIG